MIPLLTALPVVGPWVKAALSPIGLLVAALVWTGGIYGFAWHRGKARAENACQTAALRAEIATLKADIAIARQAEADAATRAAAIEASAAADRKIVEEISRAPSNPACRIDDAAARRLSRIGGGTRR